MGIEKMNQTDFRIIAKIISILEFIFICLLGGIMMGFVKIYTTSWKAHVINLDLDVVNWTTWMFIFFIGTLLILELKTSDLLYRATRRDANPLVALEQANFWLFATVTFTLIQVASTILSVYFLGFLWGWMILALLLATKGVFVFAVWRFTWDLKWKDATGRASLTV